MAWLDRGLKQRIVGALVLVALVVIFLPMLFSGDDAPREVDVEAPPMPETPVVQETPPEPVQVPEPIEPPSLAQETVPPVSEPVLIEDSVPADRTQAPPPIEPLPATEPAPQAAPTPSPAPPAPQLEASNLPVSWSIQLASLSNRANAEALVQRLRGNGYNAYVRQFEGMNRVFVGPVVDRAEATRMRDQLQRQQQLNGFVVRFEPERR